MNINLNHCLFISDLHFNDEITLKVMKRPFKNIKEMNDTIVDRIINKIKDFRTFFRWYDTVHLFILGDVGELSYLDKIFDYFGNYFTGLSIHIIEGTNDNYEFRWKSFFSDSKYQLFYHYYQFSIIVENLWLTHKPIDYMPAECPYLNLHGYTHTLRYGNGGSFKKGNRYFNVSAEVLNYTPIDYDKIKEKMFK